MLNRKYLFDIIIESLFSDRALDTYVEDTKVKDSSKMNYETVDWSSIVTELDQQAVLGITSLVLQQKGRKGMPDELMCHITKRRRQVIMRSTQIAVLQNKIWRVLYDHGIAVAVIKGMASAVYYPYPFIRTMGDIDLIVNPENFQMAVQTLLEFGLKKSIGSDTYHAVMEKEGYIIELHQSPASVHKDIHGNYIREFILSGLNDVEMATVEKYCFPMLPWQQNGMELIWHIRQHLYNGLGLRHIIDWMMFVDHCLDDQRYIEFEPELKKCGLLNLAATVTKMCQMYLGLRADGISWCGEVDEKLCEELMDYILEQGDFGKKKLDDKAAKVLTGYSDIGMLLREIQRKGETEWEVTKKCPVLKPFSWIYELSHLGRNGFQINDIFRGYKLARKRKRMFGMLYTMEKKRRKAVLKGRSKSRNSKKPLTLNYSLFVYIR